MSSPSKSSSQGASKGSKASPPKDVSKGAEVKGPSFSGKLKKIHIGRGSKDSKASRDSQQPSPNNENPEPALSQDADGKFTFKPEDLLSKISEEERRQAWTISESPGDGTAEMLEVCWLDVTGSMTATKGKAYEISFILSMNEDNSFGWEDPVYVMARIGEHGVYTSVEIDLSKLGPNKEEFPKEKYCRVENAKNKDDTLYFGLYEVWTNNWKGGLRIHEAIVRELTAEDPASTSNTLSDDSKEQEVTADKSTSASENPPDMSIMNQVPASPDEVTSDDSPTTCTSCFPVLTSRNYQ